MRRFCIALALVLVAGCSPQPNDKSKTGPDPEPSPSPPAASAAPAVPSAAGPAVTPPPSAKLELRATSLDGKTVTGSGPFEVKRTARIAIAVDASALGASGSEPRIDVRTPSKALYQSFRAKIEGGTATVELPIVGTHISQYGLTGSWTVELRVDGASSPDATAGFVLK